MMRAPKVDFHNDTTTGRVACRQCNEKAKEVLDELLAHFGGRDFLDWNISEVIRILEWKRRRLDHSPTKPRA